MWCTARCNTHPAPVYSSARKPNLSMRFGAFHGAFSVGKRKFYVNNKAIYFVVKSMCALVNIKLFLSMKVWTFRGSTILLL